MHFSSMVRSQNDLYMVVNNNGAEINAMGDDIFGGTGQWKADHWGVAALCKKYLSVYFKCSGYETSVKTVGGSEGI